MYIPIYMYPLIEISYLQIFDLFTTLTEYKYHISVPVIVEWVPRNAKDNEMYDFKFTSKYC